MKYLLVLLVVVVGLWMLLGRQRRPPGKPPRGVAGPQAMLQCAHCGLHLPKEEAETDDAGRAYCSQAHRLAGSR